MERYAEYKDSGVEWIGEIPEGWEVEKVKHSSSLAGRIGWQGLTSSEYQNEGPFLITGVNFSKGGIDWSSCVHISNERWAEADQVQICNGDLLITKDGTVGKLAVVSGLSAKASLNSGVMVIRKRVATYRTKFLYYVLSSEIFRSWFSFINSGNSTIIHLYQGSFQNFSFPLPSLHEQTAIVDYLAAKTTEIDEIVGGAERSIELLREYRKSVISEAVTKGLNPDAPMKDSGIDWIGKIPEGWTVKPFKYVARVCANLVHPDDYPTLRQVAPENIEKDAGHLNECRTVSETGVSSDNHLFHEGQILYSKVRPQLNKVAVAPFDGLCSADMYPIETQELTEWLKYYMLSDTFLTQVRVSTDRVKMPKVNQEELSHFLVVVPDGDNQNAIADYLDVKTAEIDSLIADKEKQIELLKEYRKSLISEAVTGKFKVPGLE